MSFFSGSFKKKKSGYNGATSPRSSMDSSSRRSQGTFDSSHEEPPESDDKILELFDQMLVKKKFKIIYIYTFFFEQKNSCIII